MDTGQPTPSDFTRIVEGPGCLSDRYSTGPLNSEGRSPPDVDATTVRIPPLSAGTRPSTTFATVQIIRWPRELGDPKQSIAARPDPTDTPFPSRSGHVVVARRTIMEGVTPRMGRMINSDEGQTQVHRCRIRTFVES
ncbi:hypothetical protein R1flu_025635 [Riccia fluitans]|uniref:Uncharacterized protein n=1 Tax=Riccia fluitans TaxID=41844 RepID=A0ABD1XYB2_9MARC